MQNHMAYTTDTHKVTTQFMQTLQQIEKTGDVEPLVALFAKDAELINLSMPEPLVGQDGAHRFWDKYLSVFNRIHSEFTNVIESDGASVLEWISTGSLSTSENVTYQGVSVLEFKDGKVCRFRTYYDSATFLPQGAKQR